MFFVLPNFFVCLGFVVLSEFIHVCHEQKVELSLIKKRCPAEASILTAVLTVHGSVTS